MRSRGLTLLLGILIVCAGISCGRTARRAWIEDGNRLGTIYLVKDGSGIFYDHRDSQRRLVRRERHLRNGELDRSFAIENYEYDQAGRETTLSFTDPLGESTLGPEGFATRRTEHRRGDDYQLIDYRHYDSNDSPMLIPTGYHREQAQIGEDGRLKRRRFYDRDDQPVGVDFGIVSGITEVRYKLLMGTTPIEYETFFDLDGKPVLKRPLSGSTSTTRTKKTHYHER